MREGEIDRSQIQQESSLLAGREKMLYADINRSSLSLYLQLEQWGRCKEIMPSGKDLGLLETQK